MRAFAWLILLTVPGVAWAAKVQGTAVLDDGLPAERPILVQIVCEGRTVAEGEADPNGSFALRWEDQDTACSVAASLPGYRPAAVAIEDLPADPAIPSLTLHREGKWQGESISAAFLGAPQAARQAFKSGYESLRAGDNAAAETAFREAVETDPQYAAAWFGLAQLRLAANDVKSAMTMLTSAVDADPWFVPPYEPLLLLNLQARNWKAVQALASDMLEMNPHLPEMRYRRALAVFELGDIERAQADLEALAGATVPGLEQLRKRVRQEAQR